MSESEETSHWDDSGQRPADASSIDPHSVDPQSIEGLFLTALQKSSPSQREEFLRERCGDDVERRNRVTALLRAYEDAGSFLETPVGGTPRRDDISLDFLLPSEKPECLGILGPYEVLEVIGRGGMGIVLRAFESKLNRIVAVKVLLPHLAANSTARRRFLREAQAAAAVSHPHVVTIHAVEEATDRTPPYLVMECVVGQSLQEKLDANGPPRLAEILRISRQIAEGLAAAHKQGLIHRDIKPANILLENGVERVTITDFGLARAIDDITVTRAGEVSGTPQYMSPEQASGHRVDHRSDLFSLGCVMYAMCTGHSPFRAESLAQAIKRVTQDTPRDITDQNPEVPAWLAQIVIRLLEKNADQRFDSADELVGILDLHLARLQRPADPDSHTQINKRISSATGNQPTTEAHRRSSATQASDSVVATNSGSWLRFGIGLLIAAVVGAVLSPIILPESLFNTDLQAVERRLLQFLGVAAAAIVVSVAVCFAALGPNRQARHWSLVISSLVGTVACGFGWATLLRSGSAASQTDFALSSLLMLCWLAFVGYAGRTVVGATEPRHAEQLETLHARVGRRSFQLALFVAVFPACLMLTGVLIDGDIMEFAAIAMITAIPACLVLIVAGYVLRYVLGGEQRRRIDAVFPIVIAALLAVAIGFVHNLIDSPPSPKPAPVRRSNSMMTRAQPTVVFRHPEWEIRELLVNRGGSTRYVVSPNETIVKLPLDSLHNTAAIHVILKDGREYLRHVLPVNQQETEIVLSDEDLELRNQALVEVVEDMPGVKLRMVNYPTQKISNNEFSILDPPFHKALLPGVHRIVLDYVREEWEIPAGFIQYAKLDYRVAVPDTNPIKLSLKEIIEQHGSNERIRRMSWNPDFIPLPNGTEE